MVGFDETIKKVVGVEREEGDEGFTWLVATVETAGGIRKRLRLPYYHAQLLRALLAQTFDLMSDDEREASWEASLPGKK